MLDLWSSGTCIRASSPIWPHWLFKFWEFQLPLRKLNVCLVQRAGPLGAGVRDSVPKEEHRLYMAMPMSLEESRAVRFTSSGFQRAERAELGKTKASWNCQCMQVIIEESHICFLHWTQKAVTIFPISLLGEGPEECKTVPVPPVRFCIRFQRFTVPTVRKLFDFLRFGSTVPVRFQNLHEKMEPEQMIFHSCNPC